MRTLGHELRRNPDILAVGLLCLLLGVGKRSAPPPAWFADVPVRVGIHRIWTDPARTALDAVCERLHLICLDFRR